MFSRLLRAILPLGLCICISLLGWGCGNSSINTTKNQSKSVERISFDSLDSLSEQELGNDVIKYIENNPDKIEPVAQYAMLTRTYHNNMKIRQKNKSDGAVQAEIVFNSIPLVGGMIIDSSNESMLESYKKALISKIGDYSTAKNVTDDLLNKGVITSETHDIFLELNMKNEIDNEAYNNSMKISALMYRELEAVVEDAKIRVGMSPDIFDVIDIATYAVFNKSENARKASDAHRALESIYKAIEPRTGTLDIVKYWDSKIPKWLFPYRFSNQVIADEKDKIYYENTAPQELRENLYSLVNGTWESLITGESVVFQLNPKLDHRLYETKKIGFIGCMDYDKKYIHFNFPDALGTFFITQISYTYPFKEKSEDVLLMYRDYDFISFNGSDQKAGYSKNLRIENMKRAADVLIKHKNTNGTFESPFDARKAFEILKNKYYLSNKYSPADFPDFNNDYIYEMLEPLMSNKTHWDKMVNNINGTWKSVISGQKYNFNISYSNKRPSCNYYLNYISFIGKDSDHALCVVTDYATRSSRKKILIIPAINIATNERQNLMYINYKLIKYNGHDKNGGFVENMTIDNIQDAEDVLIKE